MGHWCVLVRNTLDYFSHGNAIVLHSNAYIAKARGDEFPPMYQMGGISDELSGSYFCLILDGSVDL